MTTLCSSRSVKQALVLADCMKQGPFDPDGFRRKLEAERTHLAGLHESELDKAIKDPKRLRRINEGQWVLTAVELACCSIWPEMGKRKSEAKKKWASGPVGTAAKEFKKHREDRVWAMVKSVELAVAHLPLVVLRRKRVGTQFRIDDGCHRAVAFYLAGGRLALAYVGQVPPQINEDWRWEGEL